MTTCSFSHDQLIAYRHRNSEGQQRTSSCSGIGTVCNMAGTQYPVWCDEQRRSVWYFWAGTRSYVNGGFLPVTDLLESWSRHLRCKIHTWFLVIRHTLKIIIYTQCHFRLGLLASSSVNYYIRHTFGLVLTSFCIEEWLSLYTMYVFQLALGWIYECENCHQLTFNNSHVPHSV